MTKPFQVHVPSPYGAPMGRRSQEIPEGTKVRLQRVPMVDSCYDQGGAYWGSPDGLYVFCAWDRNGNAIYVWAKDREEAKTKLPEGLRYYR